MPKHEPLFNMIPCLAICAHDISDCLMDDNKVAVEYRRTGAKYNKLDWGQVTDVMIQVTKRLESMVAEHSTSQAGRANPRYWLDPRTIQF